MRRVVRIYKKGSSTCVDEIINGKEHSFSTNENRELKVINGGVLIMPDDSKILNNFTILISELEGSFEATTGKELRNEILVKGYFKKGGGGVLGGDVPLAEFTVKGTSFGRFSDGDTVPAHDSTQERFKDAYIVAIAPTFNNPTLALSGNPTISNSREVGETLDITLSAAFSQNDGGSAIETIYKKAGINLPGNTDTIVLATAAKIYNATTSYNAGTGTKPNNLGNEIDNTITAGSVTSNSLSYRGYLPIFQGSTASKNTDSNTIRTNLIKRLTNSGNTFNLETGVVNKFFQFWLPTGTNLVRVIHTNINDDLTASFISEDVSILNIGGSSITGKLYTLSIDVAFSTSQTFQIMKS